MSRNVPSGWTTASIQELCEGGIFTDGDWIESKDQDPSGHIRLVQLADIGDGTFLNKSSRWINAETAMRLSVTKLHRGDILLARMPDPIGRSCIFPLESEAITAVDICIIRPSTQTCVREWLVQILNSAEVRAEIAQHATGTTRQRISRGNLGNIQLLVPPPSEQLRIAEILSSVDEAIEATQAVVEQTRKVKQGALNRLLTKGIGHTQFKHTEIGETPESWDVKPLGSIATFQPGYAFKSAEFSQQGDRLLRGSNVGVGKTDWDPSITKHFPSDRRHEFADYVLSEGDIVVAMDRPFISDGFKVARIASADLPALLLQRVGRFQTGPLCDADWLWQIITAGTLRNHLEQRQVGTDLPHISKKDIETCLLAVPPIAEQKEIAQSVVDIDHSISAASDQLVAYTRLKTALMSNLLTGRKRVFADLAMAAE